MRAGFFLPKTGSTTGNRPRSGHVFFDVELTRFRTKVDLWLAAIIATGAAIATLAGILSSLEGVHSAWIALAGYLGVLAAFTWPCTYTLADSELVVQSGWIRYRIPYHEIVAIRPTRAVWSAPAWSLDRLSIEQQNGMSLLISPRAQADFIQALSARCPNLSDPKTF